MSDPYPQLSGVLQQLAMPQAARAAIMERHGEPHRHYHTLRHLDLMLRQIPADHAFAREMFMATLFHDIVYEPSRADNEEQSLAVFRSVATAPGFDVAVDTGLVGEMILATKSHHFREGGTPADQAVNLLLKADLGILWHPDPAVYQWYAAGVRQEYAFVPDDAFRQTRTRILTSLRDDLQRSGKLDGDEEAMLVRNIKWEINNLG